MCKVRVQSQPFARGCPVFHVDKIVVSSLNGLLPCGKLFAHQR